MFHSTLLDFSHTYFETALSLVRQHILRRSLSVFHCQLSTQDRTLTDVYGMLTFIYLSCEQALSSALVELQRYLKAQ